MQGLGDQVGLEGSMGPEEQGPRPFLDPSPLPHPVLLFSLPDFMSLYLCIFCLGYKQDLGRPALETWQRKY